MKSYEFSRYYNPRSGRFVFRHKGTGLIVDNIFKPMRKVASAVFSKFAKPIAKKALQSGISHAGDKLGKKAAEKSGDLIMKKLGNMKIGSKKQLLPQSQQSKPKPSPPAPPSGKKPPGESSDEILNRLISGQGVKRAGRNPKKKKMI